MRKSFLWFIIAGLLNGIILWIHQHLKEIVANQCVS